MNFEKVVWNDYPGNPLIEPRWPEWMIADPTVLTPDDSPDGRWHLFANSLLGVHHFAGRDGVEWKYLRKVGPMGMRPFVRRHGGVYFLFYEKFDPPPFRSNIVVRRSDDLKKWSDEKTALSGSLPWHKSGIFKTRGNPCAVLWKDEYLLFYSAGVVFLKDCMFFEPRHIGVARAASIEGPYVPDAEPIISPGPAGEFHNLGAGAIKVVADEENGVLWGFNNGIYIDAENKSRSAILLIKSTDGVAWTPVGGGRPILKPEAGGWKRALVYALDVRLIGNEAYLYYNARDGWFIGKERIGLAIGREA